ncbi:hypothetical protein GCM10022419_116710 [Nonomuraea rosea]|uniref:Secreted protein n=1 Tax=Nonomuraea rosea TaxID=638574 RepID=A0ABP6ZK36_9ACTN
MRRKMAVILLSFAITIGGGIALSAPAWAEWRIIQIYKKGSDCEIAGRYYVNHTEAIHYFCDWDSPGFALHVYYPDT